MKILALEFSSPMRSVAVAVGNEVRGRATEHGARQTNAFALISESLQQASVAREDIECIAVGAGPGSYAGVRIAIAIAQGWALAKPMKLLGINSADCVAARLHAGGTRGLISVLAQAQKEEMFAARYRLGNTWELVEPFAPLAPEESGKRAQAGEILVRLATNPTETDAVFPDATFLAQLAATRSDFMESAQLEPVYLRQAEFIKAPAPRFNAL
jgi:tRNA threonylcarbamoyl adenosine modification protein YeaZ